jgi:uncharacterized membrane protein YhaH (DUF805 family)
MNVLRALFSFSGRLARLEYFTTNILASIVMVGLAVSFAVLTEGREAAQSVLSIPVVAMWLWLIFSPLAKRFHDIGKPGFWCLILFVPVIGGIALIVMLFYPGEESTNVYGPPRSAFFG